MLRRSILEISSRRSVGRVSPRITTQIPLYLSLRKEYSVASQPNSAGKPPGSNLSKVFIGTVALGAAAVITAYQTGYLDKPLTKEVKEENNNNLVTHPSPVLHEHQQLNTVDEDLHDGETVEQGAVQNVQQSEISSPPVDHGEKDIGSDPYYGRREEENTSGTKQLPIADVVSDHNMPPSDDASTNSNSVTQIQEDSGTKDHDVKPTAEQHDEVQITSRPTYSASIVEENVVKSDPPRHLDTADTLQGYGTKDPNSLLDEYLVRGEPEQKAATSSNEDKEVTAAVESADDVYVSKGGTLILDLLEAIHAAEKRQADLDAQVFLEEKRLMKEKYEKELKDARARELMYAERETILDKELHKEKLKAAAALKALQEELEEELKREIERKETEKETELKKLKDLSKAELLTAIAKEKASQLEKLEEANLNINALCMAFYARSEEARQTHSLHKLSLGALALEDALSKGLPIQKEIDALTSYMDGVDKDSLLGLVMASLPQDTLENGTNTILQLHRKFDGLKGSLRHYSLMPPGGGGILAHSLAYIASHLLKVKEADKSGDGIESVINRVENLLADGKLVEAAETLEKGVKGSQAEEIVGDWVQQARNRAITEQALTIIQSYATSASLA